MIFRIIVKGFYEDIYEIEADSKEDALRIFEEHPEEALYLERDYYIRDSDHLNVEIDEH